jgi:glucosamine--fructose-6-phosphate aminotransferase (isomerizing)
MMANHLLNEILEQPTALRRIIEHYCMGDSSALDNAAKLMRGSSSILMTGMVTSQFGAYPASLLLNQHGKPTLIHDASELLHYQADEMPEDSCLVAISQSGESAEIVRLLEKMNGRIPVIGVYNDEDSYLAKHCDAGLPLLSGPQLACGSKTNLSTVAVMLLLATQTVGGDLQAERDHLAAAANGIEQVTNEWESAIIPAADVLEGSDYTVFLGRGPGLASALFSAVLFKEVPKAVVDGMSAASFRHGLLEMIRPQHRVVIFAPMGRTHDLTVNLIRCMCSAPRQRMNSGLR